MRRPNHGTLRMHNGDDGDVRSKIQPTVSHFLDLMDFSGVTVGLLYSCVHF